MDNSEDKKWLYDKLKANGLGISYKDFENTLGNEEDLKWYYDRANTIGLQVGSYDDFSTLFSSKPASVAQQVIDEYDASMGNARSQEATNTQPSPSPTPDQTNMYDGSQFAQAFQAPDWRSEENKLMDEIATSGKATVATLDGVGRYPTKPLEVRYDESVREAASKVTSKVASQKQSAADQLNSLYDDINKQVDAIPRRVPRPYEAMAGLTDQQLEENRLRAAQRIVEDAKEVLEEAGKKGNTNFVAGLGRGIADKIADPENWNFGITDLADNKYLLDALKKSEKGEELTPAEDKLLQAATTSMAVNYYYSQDLGRGYKAGKTTAESIPFMLEFMINPVSASGSGIAKSLLKYGMKKFGAKAVNRGITRAAGRLIGDAAAAAGMTATTGAARTLASSYEKQAENYDYRYDDTGNVVVQKTGDMGQGEALARGFLSNFLENQSEMVFGAFSGAGKSLSGIIPSIGKLSNSGLVRFYNSIKNAPLAKQLRDRAKIGGVVEEYAEEVYNNFANVATGEMSAEDALSIDNNIDTFLGLVPTQLAFSAIGLGGLARENMAAQKRIRAFEAGLSEEEKNVLTQLQDAVRSGDNNVARDYIKATLADNNLTDQEKKERIFSARDIVTAQQAEQLEQDQTVTEQETDASYAEGASADPSTYHDRYKASQQAGAALEQVDPSLYDTINRYVEDDASAGEVDNLLSGLEGETEQLARTYLNSLMQLKGAEDSQMQDAVEAVDAFDQSIQPYAYQNEDGTRSITTGTYKERPVYVIPGDGGNVTVVYEDGSREMALSQYVEGQETTDYDEFIDSYNRSYLEEKEAAFRNFLENHPKTQQPAPGVVLHNGDVTYVVTNVSEDGYVDIVPATFDAETGQTVPKNGAAQQTISYSTAMMLQNDYYSSLDNQGSTSISTENSSNLSKNKAENESRPSDGESNVLETTVEDTPEQRLANFIANLPKKGKTEEIDYNALTPLQRYEYTSLIESPEIAAEDLQADIAAKQKQLEAVQKKLDSAVGGKRTEIRDQIRKLRNELKELTDYYQSIVTPVQQEQVVPEVASQAQEETSQSLDDAVPDVVNDKASDARQRGYRMVNGQRVDRQEQIPMQQGRETDVRFSQNDTAKARFAIVDATYLQPSHIGGVRNSLFFIDEAQPKDRVDNASVMAADRMARDIRPEEITGGVTAYTGSPVINLRGEVIQGNNRSAALRIMYQIPGADATYREYLNQHAEEYGLTAEQINSVQSPVLVRVADVTDNEAIRLGQMTAQDTESGGIERIKPTQTATKLGDSLQSFNRILLSSQEEDVSLSDLVSENGVQALKFLRQQGSISDTQYQSAFDSNGNLTPEAKQDLIAILQTSLFEGGPDLLPQMFRALPAKAQKAILSTFVRDEQSPEESRIKKDIQNAIQAFYAAMQFPDFAKATNYESARNAIEQWKRQINMIDGVAPMQVFDNFALELAVRFKGYTMKRITDEFNSYYDLVQGAGADLFSDTASPVEQGEAIRRIFNIQTNEQEGNDAVGSDNTGSEEGRTGSAGNLEGGERDQNEGGPSDTGRGTETTDGSEQQVKTSLSESPESANERRMNQIIERLDEIEYRLSELEGTTDIFSEAEQITLNNEKNELESEFEGLRKINATSAAIQEARNDVNPSPTEAQKEAGNYKKGHVTIDGLNITIENPKGSTRSGKDASGKEWSVTMQNDYGYIRGTKAVDGDHIDIFLSDNPTSGNVYVVDAIDQKTGTFDESKVMYGFNSLEEARDAYLSNYSEGWKVGPITEVSKEGFKKWIDSSTRKGKPFGEYKSVKSNVTAPQQLPKILKEAYESEDKASITNAETLLREYVDSQNNLKQISTTYFRSMDNLRKEKDKSSPSYKMNDFIAKTCKDALKKAGIAPDTLMSEKKRMEFANATKDANVLDVMSVDPSFDVLKAVVRNPNTSNNTLQNIADNTNYSYLSDEAKQILEERNSNQELANENQPNFSPNEPKETEQEEVKVESKDKFVGYKEFIDNLFEQEELILTPYKNLSEWKEKDEEYYANRYDARIDEFIKRYVSYIKELSDNGTLQRIYDHSSLKNQKEIRDNLADAGLEYKDYIDTKVNRKRIPQKADEKSDLKEGSEVNARFYDGTIVSGTIESIENNKIGIRTNNGRLYNVPLNRILDDDNNVLFRDNGILDEVNEQFNQELQQQIDGTLPNGHIYSLGNPSDILLSTGTPNLPIELSSTRLAEKSDQRNHEFAISDVKNLPEALQSPLAVFSYGDKSKAQNVIVELEKNGKKFVIGLHLNQIRKGIEVNSIRGLFPKNNAEWLNWINQNKALYLNKEKIQALIDKQRTNLADVEYLDLDSTTKIVENFENPKLEENNYREGQGPQTDASVSLANDPASRIAGAPRRSRKQQEEYAERERRRMENAANRMVEKLGLDNVEVVTDASTLEGDKAKAKGFYSPSTGKITIVLPNHVSSFDVEQTILHEAVAHYGLRRLFGDNFDTFLDNVYNNASAEIRERINKLAKKYNGNYRTATEEYLASLAEKTDFENAVNSGWFNKIKAFFLKMLAKAGVYLPELTDNELRYILWRSYENLAHPGHYRNVFDTAADVAKQNELKVGNYAESKLAPDVAAENDVLFRTSSVEDLLEDWHIYVPNGPNIHLINNEEDIDRLPYGRFTKIELKEKLNNKRCTGGYSNRNGAIFLFPEHISEDTEELELTLWHETAHYASRQLGLDERLKNSCLDYIKNRYPDIYKEITSYYDRSRWSEEAVAYLFERKIKEFGAKKLLSSTFAGESDIAETFTKLINFIKNGKGNTESGRNSGSTGNTSGKNTERSVFGGRGNDLLDERRKIEGGETETDIYDDQELNIVNKEVGSAREQYERTLKTAAFKFTEAWQDSMLGLKEAQDAIAKATNSRILDYENAYIAENAMSSISLAEMDAFRNLVLKPILQEVNNLKKQGAAYEEITDYLMLKHGIERNREMAVREALSGDKETMQENMDRWNEEKKSVIESSGTWEEKQRQLDKIALMFGAELKDYSGMTDILNEYNNMEERTEEAYRIVNEFEEEYDTEALYDRIHDATDATLKKQVESGLMSKEMYQSISDMYEFYVPLRGWEEKTADEVYDYLTTEHSSFNAPVRKAKGRKSKADDPIANIANVAESGIVQGNRNLVKQRFLTMVQNHRTDLASVNNLWVQEVEREDKNGNTVKEWVAVFPEIAKDATPEQVERIMEAFNKRMEEKSKQEGSNVKRASDMVNIPYKILPKDLKEHQVVVKRAGKPYVITINGNPRAAQAINGLTNPNATENPFIKFVESANRFMAANFTQRNPAFVVANMVRDGIYANTSVWVKEDPLYAAKFNRNWAKSVKEMAGLVARYKSNRLDMSNPTERMFYDFIRNGGETGYTFINSVEDYKGIIQKEIKRANRKTLSPMKAVDVLGNAMDTFGRWAEDASRFAAYRTSREMGRSVARSINDAKEISVNFNRKGAGAKAAGKWEKGNRINALQAWASQMARGLYIFWNAGVQGLTNFGRMARRNPGKFTAMASSYLVLGSLAPLINEVLCSALGGDDDDSNYYNLPEYVRRNNICLYVGGSWLTIPLPIELRALYGLGEMTCSFLTGKEKYKPVKVAGQISQILPIDFLEGSGGLNAFVPSYVKPLVEVYNNKSWTGIPIYRDNAFNKDMPNWTKAYKSTSPELVELSERLNELKGLNNIRGGNKYVKGDIDINPAAIEYLFKSYLGGVATTIDQVKKTAMMPFNEDMRDWRNVVIANRFLKNADERSTQKRINNEYFENKEEFDKVRQEFNGYRKELSRLNPNMEEFAKYRVLMDELVKSDRFRKYQEFHAMDKELNRMFEAFKENGSEELEEQMFILKEAMNEVARSK